MKRWWDSIEFVALVRDVISHLIPCSYNDSMIIRLVKERQSYIVYHTQEHHRSYSVDRFFAERYIRIRSRSYKLYA